MRIGKAPHDQVGLARAAMPGAKQQPPPALVEAVARSGAAGHEFSNAKNPAEAGRGIYIERLAGNVSGAGREPSRQHRDELMGVADLLPQLIQVALSLRR